MASPTIHAAIPEEVAEWVTRREALRGEARTLSRAAASELRTFRDLLDAELARTRWSLAELELLARSTMGTTAGPGLSTSVGAMFGAVFDARRLGAEWWAGEHEHTPVDWEAAGVRVATD